MAQQDDVYDRLDEQHAPSLPRLQVGDRFAGEVVRIDRRVGAYGTYPILTLKLDRADVSDDDELAAGDVRSWHVLHGVAQNELARLRVKVGETVAAKYEGQRDSTTGKGKYHAWRVVVDRSTSEFDWGEFGDPATAAEPAGVAASDVTPATDDDIPF